MWEVVKDGVVMAHGPEVTMSGKELRQKLRADGYEVLLDGRKVR